jgi:Trp operon repressor
MELTNVASNRKRSKKREKNEYSVVTDLVKKYKKTNDNNDLLEVLKNLEGIVNSFTIMLSPGNKHQQIHINPFMAKFLGMFLTPEERAAKVTHETYYKAIARVRWVMRKYDYEEIYSQTVEILIKTIKSMDVIGDCDCIYYIQLIARFKIHDLVLKTSRDAGMANAVDIPINFNDPDEQVDEVLDRMSFSKENLKYEDSLILSLYDADDISVLARKDDIWKCLSPYEKYLIYLYDIMGLTKKQILSILRFETSEELDERINDIIYKCELIANEGE